MKTILIFLLLISGVSSYAQQPIYVTIPGGDLYSIDLQNCTREFIGSTSQGFGDMAMTDDGRLWGIINGELYEIDTETAEVTLAGSTGGLTPNNLVALNDSILLGESQLNLYGLNVNDQSSYLIGYIGYGAAGDLTWYDDDLYMVSPLIRIELNETYTAVEDVTEVNLQLPICEGAVTVPMPDDYNAIIGFNGQNAIRVCHLDGTYEMLCPDVNIGGTPGAATLRLPNQTPEPATCSMVSVSDKAPYPGLTLFPNPASDMLTVRSANTGQRPFRILNSFGQLQQSGMLSGGVTEVDVSGLSSGVYYLEHEDATAVQRMQFVVQH